MAHECSRDGTCSFGFETCYYHTKVRARAGEELTPEQPDHIGVYEPRARVDGWVDASTLGPSFEISSLLEGEDGDLYRALVTPTYTEFLA